MKKIISMLIRHWIKTPVKMSLTVIAVALGTGILILSFSAGSIIENEIKTLLSQEGTVLQVVNGEWGSDGSIEQERPATWDYSITEKLVTDSSSITDVSVLFTMPIPNLSANGKSYQVRTAYGTDTSYLNIFGLDIVSGVEMTEEDFDSGLKKIWISEESATVLFGSADAAIGQKLIPPGSNQTRGRRQFRISQFSVAGVYESPTEVARRAYGIADVIYPVTAMLPGDGGLKMLDFISGTLVIKSSSTSVEKVQAEVASVVENNFGFDISVTTWEGTPTGTSQYMEELRQTIAIFSTSIKILGIVLLLTSSLGIFSIMVVEALGRKKEIAIERALGASKLQVVKEFWLWSIVLSTIGALFGVILAAALSPTVLGSMSPLLNELTDNMVLNTTIKPLAVFNGIILALGCGGILGVLPSFSATRGSISDTLREE